MSERASEDRPLARKLGGLGPCLPRKFISKNKSLSLILLSILKLTVEDYYSIAAPLLMDYLNIDYDRIYYLTDKDWAPYVFPRH